MQQPNFSSSSVCDLALHACCIFHDVDSFLNLNLNWMFECTGVVACHTAVDACYSIYVHCSWHFSHSKHQLQVCEQGLKCCPRMCLMHAAELRDCCVGYVGVCHLYQPQTIAF